MVWSGIMLVLLLAGTLVGSMMLRSQRPFNIGDYRHVNIQDAEEVFRQTGSNESLVLLLKALCFRQESLGENSWTGQLLSYGQELYARARAETIDLQTADQEQILLQVLAVLRAVGADRP